MCGACFGRRAFLTGAVATVGSGMAGCDRISLVPDAKVEEMGLRAWREISAATPLSDNAGWQDALSATATRLLRTAGKAPGDWEVAVFASPEVNAFALPGGKIGVYEGMFRTIGSEDQLAAIVGHEIGHIDAAHAKERMEVEAARGAGIRLVAWLLNAGNVEYADEIAAALGVGVQYGLVLPYSRRQELEADRLGLIAMAEADYDPEEAVDLWRRMEAAAGRRPFEILATHPAPQSRIEAIEAMLPEIT